MGIAFFGFHPYIMWHQFPCQRIPFLEKEDISDEVGCQCHLSLKLDSQENIIVILSLYGIDVEFSLMHPIL